MDIDITMMEGFPTAAELLKIKKEQRNKEILYNILNKLTETAGASVLWTNEFPEECIDFLRDKGYLVRSVPNPFTKGEWCFDISCEREED